MTDTSINVLGTEYRVVETKDVLSTEALGDCDRFNRLIRIAPVEAIFQESDDMVAKETKYREVFRHEVIHAFLLESGLEYYGNDETLVQWIASMLPRIFNVLKHEWDK